MLINVSCPLKGHHKWSLERQKTVAFERQNEAINCRILVRSRELSSP